MRTADVACSRLILAAAMLTTVGLSRAAHTFPAWPAKIRRDHPRLYFNKDTFPAVRARALGPERSWYGKMKARVDNTGAKPARRDWGETAALAAFVWQATGDRAYLAKARQLLERSAAYYTARAAAGGKDVNWFSTSRICAWAALDWLWNDLPAETRRRIGAELLEHTRLVQPGSGLKLSRWNRGNFRSGFYSTPSLLWYAGLVLDREGVNDSLAREYLIRGHDLYHQVLAYRRSCAGDDGGAATTVVSGYALTTYPLAEFNFLYTWFSATGEEIAPEWPHIAQLPSYVFWNAVPGGFHFGNGDDGHETNRFPEKFVYDHMCDIMHFYARSDPAQAAVARWTRERFGQPFRHWRLFPFYPFLRVHLDKAPPAAAAPRDMPLARHFENMGQIFMRSGSGPDDTYLLFMAGGTLRSGHSHFDNLHFGLYHKGFLALDTGTRPREGGNTQTHYYCRTIAHNCLTIRWPEEKMAQGHWGWPAKGEERNLPIPNDGGQSSKGGSKVVAFESTPHYAYAAGEATACYASAKCELCLRQIVFVPPSHVVIFDRVTSTRPSYEKRWLLHTANEPQIKNGTFNSEHKEGRALFHTLLPKAARIIKIGGPGKRFWVDGRNYPLPEGARYSKEPLDPDNPLLGQWRVEVRPGAARKADVFLHLIQTGDRGRLTTMTRHELAGDARMPGVAFETNDGRKVNVRFATTGSAGGHIRISGPGLAVECPLTKSVQKQQGFTGM